MSCHDVLSVTAAANVILKWVVIRILRASFAIVTLICTIVVRACEHVVHLIVAAGIGAIINDRRSGISGISSDRIIGVCDVREGGEHSQT